MTGSSVSADPIVDEAQHNGLLQLLFNSLVLSHITPYLEVTDLFSLAATSRAFRYLIYHDPQVFRYVDLGKCKSLQFNDDVEKGLTAGMESQTEDE